MEDNLKLYTKIQELVKNEARNIATEVYNTLGTQYGVAQIPAHIHNGVDSVQLTLSDLIQGNKYQSFLVEDISETTTIGGIFNPSRISFSGFAANNKTVPATKRALINGEVNFGTCFAVTDLVPPLVISTNGPGVPFIQGGNAIYIDSTDLTKNRVTAGNISFILARDDTGTDIVTATILSYNNQLGLLTISFVLATDWKLQGNLVIS